MSVIITSSMVTIEQIVSMYEERRKERSLQLQRATDIKNQYNADIVIPLPELEANEKPAVANLLVTGVDQTAMRIASTQPDPLFAPTRPGIKKQEDLARDRRRAMLGFWTLNKMNLKTRKRARHLVAYASSPVVIRPDFKRKIPEWCGYDPLMTYPPSGDEMAPLDCIFTYYRTLKWLRENYPPVTAQLLLDEQSRYGQRKFNPNSLYQLIEYVDADWTVIGVMRKARNEIEMGQNTDGSSAYELTRAANLSGVCPAVVPGRITLDRRQGQFDSLVGMFQQQAKLQALTIHATERGIFKDEWIIGRQNETPEILQMADGRRGVYGRIEGGDIKEVGVDPSYMANPMIDRLDAAQRSEGGIPAQMNGLLPTNLRTGRANDSVMSNSIDPVIQEAQEIFAASREIEDRVAIAIDKGYWHRPKSFYVSWQGMTSRLDYTPSELWTTDEHTVAYSMAGADVNQMTVVIGQMLGTGLTSEKRARRMHPLVDDPDGVEEEVTAEALNKALLNSLQQQAAQPGANVADIARIMQLVVQDKKELVDAIIQVQQEAQQRQATQDQQGNPTGVQPGSPEAQPGMAAPGQGAEAGLANIQPPSPSAQNLVAQLRSLKTVNQAATTAPGTA